MALFDQMGPLINYGQQLADEAVNFIYELEPMAAKTVIFKSQYLDEKVDELSAAVSFDAAMIKYVLCMFLAYPIALIVSRIPSASIKHAAFGTVGVIMMQWTFGSQWIHSFLSSAITYLLVALWPHRKSMPIVAFTFVLTYMSAAHLYRMYTDYMGWSLDFTGPQMVLTMKLSSFGFNLFDGKQGLAEEEEIAKTNAAKLKALQSDPGANPKKVESLARKIKYHNKVLATRKNFAINSLPSPLQYFGYTYNFTNILAGPAFEYADYANPVEGKAAGSAQGVTNGRRAPGSLLPGLGRLAISIACLAIHVVGSSQMPISYLDNAEWKSSQPYWQFLLGSWFILLMVRFKYYFAWKLAEGSSIFAGFGFQGFDKEGKVIGWSGASNMDILGFELGGNVSENSRAWNQRTQGWLERYVYARTNSSLTATYAVSAFWHGFYPGYYLFFLSVPLATNASRAMKKAIRPWFQTAQGQDGAGIAFYNVLAKLTTTTHINYLVCAFQLLSWEASIRCWGNYYFFGHALMFSALAISNVVPKRKFKTKQL
eukprot:CAMPEP_0113937852 /NCGR_PEP_ID=MMETSP1339-20121228/4363_1 /TAXON_ID=94617 /ORGANISM="Fibrocapsa japonica" /LENGTH=540 /DNA_ID=CAMNT_0000940759 /DNA_START=158 /DNA_END=1780 /DNA_ORIENTATION=- /assembly_acc=CAM_ASM_000762